MPKQEYSPALVPVKEIKVVRAEGRSRGGGWLVVVPTFAEASAALLEWSHTAPGAGGGYDKCDVFITWADGETYQGRYDLVSGDLETPDLAETVRYHVGFYAGVQRPDHMTEAQYRAYIKDSRPPTLGRYEQLWRTHALQDAPVTATPAPEEAQTPEGAEAGGDGGPAVYVVVIEYDNGRNISVHSTEPGARAEVAAFARRNWSCAVKAAPGGQPLPAEPPADDNAAIGDYFWVMGSHIGEECFNVSRCVVDGSDGDDPIEILAMA